MDNRSSPIKNSKLHHKVLKHLELSLQQKDLPKSMRARGEVNEYLKDLSSQEAEMLLDCCKNYAKLYLKSVFDENEYRKAIEYFRDNQVIIFDSSEEGTKDSLRIKQAKNGNAAFTHQFHFSNTMGKMQGYELVLPDALNAKVFACLRKELDAMLQRFSSQNIEDDVPNLSGIKAIKNKVVIENNNKKTYIDQYIAKIQSFINNYAEYINIVNNQDILKKLENYGKKSNNRWNTFINDKERKEYKLVTQYASLFTNIEYDYSLFGFNDYMNDLVNYLDTRKKDDWLQQFYPLIKKDFYKGLIAGISDALNKKYGEPNRKNLTDLSINVLALLESLESNLSSKLASAGKPSSETLRTQHNELLQQQSERQKKKEELDETINNLWNEFGRLKGEKNRIATQSHSLDLTRQRLQNERSQLIQQNSNLLQIFGTEFQQGNVGISKSIEELRNQYQEKDRQSKQVTEQSNELKQQRIEVQDKLKQLEASLPQLQNDAFNAVQESFKCGSPNADAQEPWEKLSSVFSALGKDILEYNKMIKKINDIDKEFEDERNDIQERLEDLIERAFS